MITIDVPNGAKPVEIVLTGGPCSGKTTSLSYLADHLTALGWRVLIAPEAATLLIGGGLSDIGHLAATNRGAYLAVQQHLAGLQASLRDRFVALAADLGAPKTVVFYDRAELDNAAYMDPAEFTGVLHGALGQTPEQVSARYDAVIHLTTAADGAPDSYTLANNAARTETAEQAIALDRAVQQAWLGHSHYTVIANDNQGFDAKLKRTLAAVLNILGEPEPVEIERKWLLLTPPPRNLVESAVTVHIEQMYLHPTEDGAERRIRARAHGTHITYWHTTKTRRPDGHRIEHEHQISAQTYQALSELRDPASVVIRKQRHCFVYAGQHFELDTFTHPKRLWMLEAELQRADQPLTLPDLLPNMVEVTHDPAWSNAAIARRL